MPYHRYPAPFSTASSRLDHCESRSAPVVAVVQRLQEVRAGGCCADQAADTAARMADEAPGSGKGYLEEETAVVVRDVALQLFVEEAAMGLLGDVELVQPCERGVSIFDAVHSD
eukprot:COSAG01_NODE_993_length_12256_cov_6.798964_8_plen_114_part_00